MSQPPYGYYGGGYQSQYNQEYVENPPDAYNRGQAYPGADQQMAGQGQWTDGTQYSNYQIPNGNVYQPSGTYGNQAQAAQNPAYPPYQHGYPNYAQNGTRASSAQSQQRHHSISQYNPQAYSPVNPTYSTSQQGYNPAAFADPYGHVQPAAVYSQQAPSQQTYTPASYVSPSLGSPQAGFYGQSSPLPASQQWYTPPLGDSQRSTFARDYSSPPPLRSPSVTSPAATAQPQVYSTYSQPAPQRASYAPSSQPYPEHDFAPSYSNLSVQDHPYPSVSPALPEDDKYLPSPPTYSGTRPAHYPARNDRPPSISPVYTPEQQSSAHSPPPAAPPHRTATLTRHPQARPLPGPPQSNEETPTFTLRNRGQSDYDDAIRAQDELFDEVESAILNAGSPAALHNSTPRSRGETPTTESRQSPRPLFGSHSRINRNTSVVNGHLSPQASIQESAEYDVDSDAEAQAGLAAMQAAEQEDAEATRRRQSGGSGLFRGYGSQRTSHHSDVQPIQEDENDGDNYGVDMSVIDGGFDANMSYGGGPDTLARAGSTSNGATTSQAPSSNGSFRRLGTHGRQMSYDFNMDNIQPQPMYQSAARVDAEGTGGLSEPNAHFRRQSFDEGDDEGFNDYEGVSAEPPDLFYHPTQSIYRPLPPPPSASSSSVQGVETPTSTSSGLVPPTPLDSNYVPSTSGGWVPRSASLVHPRALPPVDQPMRSKTDAEERLKKQMYRNSYEQRNSIYSAFDNSATTSGIGIDLPSLPSKRFSAAKLGAADFKKCEEPWALSSIHRWLKQIADPDQVTELREPIVKEALVALFTNKVPTMNITDAEMLSDRIVDEMYKAGTLRKTEEWVRLGPGTMSGVIFQLTRSGCYSPSLHDHVVPGRCYSHHCQRTLKKVNLSALPSRVGEDWATFYKLKKEDIESVDKKEVERQNILHEIVKTEDDYMQQLNVLQVVYRDALAKMDPPIINSKKLPGFLRDVFGKTDAVKKANEDHLLAQLKYRQNEQGPWIEGFSDIFRQWIRKAKTSYIDYAAAFPGATMLMRQELERNIEFRAFLDRARSNKMADRLGWDTYLKAPITRLQRYSLLLFTVHKSMKQESEEKSNLQVAIDEIKAVTLDCDARVAEMQRKVDLADLTQKLILRSTMQQEVKLNLTHLGRELIYRGDLQRTGGNRFNWLDCHALLFDHYLILAKTVLVIQKETGAKVEKYDVSRMPIPMDLLVLESTNDDAVMKSTYMGGLTSVTTVTSRPNNVASNTSGRPGSSNDLSKLGRSTTSQSNLSLAPMPTQYERSNTASSQVSVQSTVSAPPAVTSLGDAKDSDKIVYPFRIKHLGREPYLLFAPTASNRQEWCNKIIEAKTKHANSLFAQSAEPFKLRVIADSAFYYDYPVGTGGGGKRIIISGTPVDRAIKEVETRFKDTGRPGPVCRAKVNCACNFTTPYPGKHMAAVGTDYGVYVSEIDNPRGWTKAINIPKVTQIAVLEEFSLFLLISNGALIAYHLDVVVAPDRIGSTTADSGSARKAPQKLSGRTDVGFFAVGRMKERLLVFYKKRDGLSSTFKVLEPVFQKSTEKKRGMFKRGTTEFFRDYDEFYIPTECSGINLFHSSLAVSTSKGFEVLTLDKKQSFSVPDLKAPEVASIATHIADQQTLGMLRLSEQEFLLCYEKCAVYVNKHGDVSRSVILHFVGRARAATLSGPYLILFDSDFVEVRNAQNGRLKQIIAGRDVKCLDDGGGGTVSGGSLDRANGVGQLGAAARPVKVVMQHPENERVQILVELVLDEGLKE